MHSLPSGRADRGFVMILVLLVVVALTAAVIGQLAVVQSQQLASIRDNDQVHGRAIMDHCFLRARSYLDQLRRDQAPSDFDSVLDPLGNSHPVANGGANDFDDDFIPLASFGGAEVYVPSAESAQSGLRRALHRYRFVTMDGGGCLIRFDDNADDGRVGSGTDNATPDIEGQSIDVPFRDRDLGIFVTAIGVYPVAASTPPAEAYARARTRATQKVFLGAGGSPGVVAKDALKVQSNIAICGQGGFQGSTLAYISPGNNTTVCACGDTARISGDPSPLDCNAAHTATPLCDPALPCQPGADAPITVAPIVDVKVPTPVDWLQLDAFQDPRNPKGLGDNGICEFYFRLDTTDFTWDVDPNLPGIANDVSATLMNGTPEPGEIFVWDHSDDDAQGCDVAGASLATCPVGHLVTHNCQNNADTTYLVDGQPVLKRPCKWDGGDTTNGPHVTCPLAIPNLTPCWKLVARVTTHNNEVPTPSELASTYGNVMQQDFVALAPIAISTAAGALDDNAAGGALTVVTAVAHGLVRGERIVIRAGSFSGNYTVSTTPTTTTFTTLEPDTTNLNLSARAGVANEVVLKNADEREDTSLLRHDGFTESFAPKAFEKTPNIEAVWGDPAVADNNASPPTADGAAFNIQSISDDGGLGGQNPILVTTTTPHSFAVGDSVRIDINANVGGLTYSAVYTVATSAANSFTTLEADPGNDSDADGAVAGTVRKIGANWTTLCGPCPHCSVAEPAREVASPANGRAEFVNDGATAGWGLRGDEHFHFEQKPMCSTDFFTPSILVFENQVDPLTTSAQQGRFHVLQDWGAGCPTPVQHTIIAQGHADIDLNTRICGVWSDCSTYTAATTEPCSAANRDLANGLVLRAGGACFVNQGAVFIGDMQCANIEVNLGVVNTCNIGDLIAFNDQAVGASVMNGGVSQCVAGAGLTCSKGICMNQSSTIVGNLISSGDVCLNLGAKVFGSVLGGGDGTGNIFINTGGVINGQLVSEGSIGILGNTVVNNNGTGVFGTRVTSGIVSEGSY